MGAFNDPVASLASGRLRDKIRRNSPDTLGVFKKDAAVSVGAESENPPPGDAVVLPGEDPGAPPLDIASVPPPLHTSVIVDSPVQRVRTETRPPVPQRRARRGRPPKAKAEPKRAKTRPQKDVELPVPLSREPVEAVTGVVITLPPVETLIPEDAEQVLEAAYRKLETYAKQIQNKRNEHQQLFCFTCKRSIADHSKAVMRMCPRDPVTGIYSEILFDTENCYVLALANHPEMFTPRDTTGAHLSNRDR